MLFVLVVLAHDRRRVLHFNVTDHSTAAWTGQQFREAFPWNTAPRFLLRDCDETYGDDFVRVVRSMGIEQVLIASRSPWQHPYAERMIRSSRRECLDHVFVINKRHLLRVLRQYRAYYHRRRTHLSLAKDPPELPEIEPPEEPERPRRPCGDAGGVGEPRLHLPAYEWAPETGEDLSASDRHTPISARSLAPRAASVREDEVSGMDKSEPLRK